MPAVHQPQEAQTAAWVDSCLSQYINEKAASVGGFFIPESDTAGLCGVDPGVTHGSGPLRYRFRQADFGNPFA